jgi:ferredoxin
MVPRARVFVDFWDFQLQWNNRTRKAGCDWTRLPPVLANQTSAILLYAGVAGSLSLEEVRVYASVATDSRRETRLRRWLDLFLDRQPGFRVFVRERRSQRRPVRCTKCGGTLEVCPVCSSALRSAPEKGVDAAIVTDLLSLGWDSAFDVGILVSSDADLIPGVERVQVRGIKIVNAAWLGHGHQLARTCWAHFQIDPLCESLSRPRSHDPT